MNRLAELRVEADLSQVELSAASGVSLRTIQYTENGRSTPTAVILRKLAEVLGKRLKRKVTLDELLAAPTKKGRPQKARATARA